jgi:DNA-binding transcriptional regulator YiaG
MSNTCPTNQSMSGNAAYDPDMITLREFVPNIGAPFKVILVNSARQRVSPEGEVLETCIPNMGGLLREVALARSLHERKLTPAEIKFIRKAVGLKASELANLLGISAEHLSRCEHGDRTLSLAAEKLLRVIILKRRYNSSGMIEKLKACLANDSLGKKQIERLRSVIEQYNECVADLEKAIFDFQIGSVHAAGDELCFQFELKHPEGSSANANHSQEEEEWKKAA